MIQLIVTKGKAVFDMSDLVQRITWRGRKGAAARTLDVLFIDNDKPGHDRADIDIEEGHLCSFSWKNEELFRGMFMAQAQSSSKSKPVKAYDTGIRLANNRDSFCYTNETASNIFIDVCRRFQIPICFVANTHYRIPELPKPRATGWDVITNALALTYEATGFRYYPLCVGERIQLLERHLNTDQWVVETGNNLGDYSYSKSIEKVQTRIKLLSREGTVLATARNIDLEKKIGMFQEIERVNDEMNAAQLNTLANSKLRENNKIVPRLSISNVFGQTRIITGLGVYTIIKSLNIAAHYYIEEDVHIFEGGQHSMSAKLASVTNSGSPHVS